MINLSSVQQDFSACEASLRELPLPSEAGYKGKKAAVQDKIKKVMEDLQSYPKAFVSNTAKQQCEALSKQCQVLEAVLSKGEEVLSKEDPVKPQGDKKPLRDKRAIADFKGVYTKAIENFKKDLKDFSNSINTLKESFDLIKNSMEVLASSRKNNKGLCILTQAAFKPLLAAEKAIAKIKQMGIDVPEIDKEMKKLTQRIEKNVVNHVSPETYRSEEVSLVEPKLFLNVQEKAQAVMKNLGQQKTK